MFLIGLDCLVSTALGEVRCRAQGDPLWESSAAAKTLFTVGWCHLLPHIGMGVPPTAREMLSVFVLSRNTTFDSSSGDATIARARVQNAFLPTPIG